MLDGTPITATNSYTVPSPVEGTTYSVSVTAEKNGCTSTAGTSSQKYKVNPVAVITPSGTVINCSVSQVTLQGSGGYQYRWNDNTINSQKIVTSGGLYTLTARSLGGCENSTSVTISENKVKPQNLAVTPNPNTTILTCTTVTSIELTASSTSGNVGYVWQDGTVGAILTVTAPKTYVVTVTDLDNGCQETASLQITSDKTIPTVNISADALQLTCDTTSIELVASTNATNPSYSWTGGLNTSSIDVVTPDTYAVTVTDLNTGCSNSASIDVVQDISSPIVTIVPSATRFTCDTTSIDLVANATNVAYLWGDGSTTNAITITAPNTYQVTVKNQTTGCTNTVSLDVQQNVTSPNLTIESTTTELTCSTPTIPLTANVGSANVSYLWTGGSTNALLSATSAGLYQVSVKDLQNGCLANASVTLTENKTLPTASILAPNRVLTCSSPTLSLVASGTPAGTTYKWNDNTTLANKTVNSKGTYTVTVTNPNNGCTRNASVAITENYAVPLVDIQSLPSVCLPATVNLTDAIGPLTIADTVIFYQDAALTNKVMTASVDVQTAAIYYVVGLGVNNNGCQSTPEAVMINLKDKTPVPTVDDYHECAVRGSKDLTDLVTSDKTKIKWYTSSTGETSFAGYFDAYQANTVTSYWVTNTEEGKCESERQEVNVSIEGNVDFDLQISKSEIVLNAEEVTVTATPTASSAPIANYAWTKNGESIISNGNSYQEMPYLDAVYRVSAEGMCNTIVKEVSLSVLWPTLITPSNANGKNDSFARGFSIVVFNRHGQKIFTGSDGWNGTSDGKPVFPGVYYYIVTLPDGSSKKGTIEVFKR